MYKTYKNTIEIIKELPYKILGTRETESLLVVTVELEEGKIADVKFDIKRTATEIKILNVELTQDDLKMVGSRFSSLEEIMETMANQYDVIRGAILFDRDVIFELSDRYLMVCTKPVKNGVEVVSSHIKMK